MELNFQFSHHSHNDSDTQQISDAKEALQAFDDFDWGSEIQKANQLKKVSPTLTLSLGSNDHMIWVSAFGQEDSYNFVSNCVFPGEVSGFLGFGKKQGVVSLEAGTFTKEQARRAIELFIIGAETDLRNLYENA